MRAVAAYGAKRETKLAEAKISKWEAVGMLGMTIEMLQNTSDDHHSDFQEGVAGAFNVLL